MRRQTYPQRFSTALVVAATVLLLCGAVPGEAWKSKVEPGLLEKAAAKPTEFLVVLEEQADLSRTRQLPTKAEKGRYVYEQLEKVAQRTQAPILAELGALGVEHRSFWIANMIWVRGDFAILSNLARRPSVRRVESNPVIRFKPLPGSDEAPVQRGGNGIEWNISQINADQVWAMGYDGAGAVIGGQDTGYDWDHPALIDHYRGWNGTTADHNYNWHDSIRNSTGSCGANTQAPCDDHSHGTHTMGIMVGDDGGTNQIGVAPGAAWMACRNMDQGNGTPTTYAECFEWFVAPTDLQFRNADPSRAPHVINNSWTCPPSEGCSFDTLETVIANTKAAGIVVVASAGNEGSGGCETIVTPPAIYADSFSVGATDSADQIAGFSSRGSVTVDGSNRIKPNVSAPGVGIRSSIPTNFSQDYAGLSGTSMAGPHVAAMVALLFDARPDLIGQVDVVEALIQHSSVALTTTETCGGVAGTAIPNNTYGHGRIDALQLLLGDADGDGVDNLSDCRPADPTTWDAPSPVADLSVNGGAAAQLSWSAPPDSGGIAPQYDLLRAAVADDLSGATCLESGELDTLAGDGSIPVELYCYVVRVRSACGESLGSSSDGTPRIAPICP